MPTVSASFLFASNAEGFAGCPGSADATLTYAPATGCPAGSLKARVYGRNKNVTSYWELYQTWAAFGVPTGASVTYVRLQGNYTYCDEFNTGANSTVGPYSFYAADGSTQIAEIWSGRAITSTDGSGWVEAGSTADVAVSSAYNESSASVRLRLYDSLKTANSGTAAVSTYDDQVVVTITYVEATSSSGVLNTTLDSVALSASGQVLASITGSASLTLDSLSLSASADIPIIIGGWDLYWDDEFETYHNRWDWDYGTGTGYTEAAISVDSTIAAEIGITDATAAGAYSDGNLHEDAITHLNNSHYKSRLRADILGVGTKGWGFWNGNFGAPYCIWFWWGDADNYADAEGFRLQVISNGTLLYNVEIVGLDITAWHDYEIERESDNVKFVIDGDIVGQYVGSVPTNAMRVETWIDNAYYTDPTTRFYKATGAYQRIYIDDVEYGEPANPNNIALGDLSLSASGTVGTAEASGSALITLDDISLSASASLAINGTAESTLDALALSGSGTVETVVILGTAFVTFDALALSSLGTVTISGALSTSFSDLSLSGIGSVPQKAYPASDISTGSWTPSSGSVLYAMLDETTANDTDYIQSGCNPTSDVCEVKFDSLSDPNSSASHIIRYRYAQSGSARSGSLVFSLYQGSASLATWTVASMSASVTGGEYTLSASEADAITDYTDLRLRIEAKTAS